MCKPCKVQEAGQKQREKLTDDNPRGDRRATSNAVDIEAFATSLGRSGFAVADGFAGTKAAVELRASFQRLLDSKSSEDRSLWRHGAIGGGTDGESTHLVVGHARGDVCCNLEGTEAVAPRALLPLLLRFDALLRDLQASPHLTELRGVKILQRSRAMIACYPAGGARYLRHIDNPDGNGRILTFIYYLNPGWEPRHGGQLRLYPQHQGQAQQQAQPRPGPAHADVQPSADRLCVFWSDERVPHEVLPANARRWAISTWYMDSQQRERTAQIARSLPPAELRERQKEEERAQERDFAYLEAIRVAAHRVVIDGHARLPAFFGADISAAAGKQAKPVSTATEHGAGSGCSREWTENDQAHCRVAWFDCAELAAAAGRLEVLRGHIASVDQNAARATVQSRLGLMVFEDVLVPQLRVRVRKLLFTTFCACCCVGDVSRGKDAVCTVAVHVPRAGGGKRSVVALSAGDVLLLNTQGRVQIEIEPHIAHSSTSTSTTSASAAVKLLWQWYFVPEDIASSKAAKEALLASGNARVTETETNSVVRALERDFCGHILRLAPPHTYS